ncbi:MAG: RibD family protein [Candidatus Aminicenantes bacterium]|nr:MAG: RibD family protein [Candidatus Aminicenantes bacterium]
MLPKVIMHNTISLDGALKDFEIDIGLHYKIAGQYMADVHLIGSETARTGIEMFTEDVPPEEDADFVKPEIEPGDERSLWAVIDSRGILMNLLHVFRKSGFGKDVIVLIAENTSEYYKDYLHERHYDCIVGGENRVDLRKALEILAEEYGARTVLTDAGTTLNSILLENGLVDEISLLIAPKLVGKEPLKLFEKLNPMGEGIKLELIKNEVFENSHILLKYDVLK